MTDLVLTVRGLDGNVIPNTQFKVSPAFPDDTYNPETSLTEDVLFTTDSLGVASLSLPASTNPYYVTRAVMNTDGMIAYKLFVPATTATLTLGMVYVDLKSQLKLTNDKALYTMIESKVSMLVALEQAKTASTAAGLNASLVSADKATTLAAKDDAISAAAAAGVSAAAAAVSKGLADTAQIAAETAKDDAEAARDAAIIGAGLYVDEPTGRAAVADGVAFKVQGSGEIAAYEYRRINATTATLITIYPSKSGIDRRFNELGIRIDEGLVEDSEGGEVAFALTDESGKVSIIVRGDGTVKISGLEVMPGKPLKIGEISHETKDVEGIIYGIVDEKESLALGIDECGNVITGGSSIETRDAEGIVYGIVDEKGHAALGVDERGNVITGGSSIEGIFAGNIAWAIVDEQGRAALIVENDGTVRAPMLIVPDEPAPEPVVNNLKSIANHKTDFMHVFSYGQSLSRGATANPPISTVQPYNNVTFLSGVLPRGTDAIDYSGFKPLVEAKSYSTSTEAETPTSGFANGLVELRVAAGDNAADWVFVGTAPGQGGQPIQNLHRGTVRWQGMLDQVEAAQALANAAGKSYSVWAMAWTQGENNYSTGESIQAYYDLFVKMKEDFATDVSAITKQDFKPPIICYQVAAHRRYNKDHCDIAIAQWLASRADPDIIMACSMYALPYNTDNLHLTADSSKQLGRYYARAFHEAVILGKGDWRPLEPNSIIWQNRIIDIAFNVPYGELVFDTTIVAEALNKGFDIWYSNNPIADIISSVAIVGKNRVRIVLNYDPPTGAILTYARGRPGDPATAGPVNGPRGNLRDKHGDIDNYQDSTGATRYMHNWCVIFQYQLGQGVI